MKLNSFYGLNLEKGYSQILVMKIDAREKIRSEEKEIIEEKIRIILDENFSEYNLQEREVYLDDQMAVVFLHFPEEKREDYLRRGKELLHFFKEEIPLLKNRTLTMGQGHVAKSLSELSNSYDTAVLALEDSYVKGVGEARMKLYNHMGLFTVEDLLYHLPRNYLDLRSPCTIATAPVGETVAVAGIVAAKSGEQRIRKGLSIWKVQLIDGNDRMTVTFYNAKFTVAALKVGEEYLFYGRVGGTLLRKELLSPAVHPITSSGLLPIYPLTKGLTSRAVATNVASALAQ